MKLNVFGKIVQIMREEDEWIAFYLGDDGKKRLVTDFVIPSEIKREEISTYLSDLFHEFATPELPDVKEI